MSFYKLLLKYNGYGYQGWQKQAHSDQTIQGQLEKSLIKISKSEKLHTIGSGRTDSGVHALGQVVRIEIELDIDPNALVKALNSNLPDSIQCLACETSNDKFNPVFDAKEKTYRYIFCTGERRNPHLSQLVTFLDREMDFELMKDACQAYVGKHDFADFYTTGTEVSSTVREIFSCKLHKITNTSFFGDLVGEMYEFEVTGSGFLKQMVRLMMGTLWNIGLGKVTTQELVEKLREPNGNKLAPVAASQGLYLDNVKY